MWQFIKEHVTAFRVGSSAGFLSCFGVLLRVPSIDEFTIKQGILKLIVALCVAIITGIGTVIGTHFAKHHLRPWLWKQYFRIESFFIKKKSNKDGKGKNNESEAA